MANITIPGSVTNDLRQGLTLRMGDEIETLEIASLIDRRERSYERSRSTSSKSTPSGTCSTRSGGSTSS